jgi:hypothetical protein
MNEPEVLVGLDPRLAKPASSCKDKSYPHYDIWKGEILFWGEIRQRPLDSGGSDKRKGGPPKEVLLLAQEKTPDSGSTITINRINEPFYICKGIVISITQSGPKPATGAAHEHDV